MASITIPHHEGICSRQAHADFPDQAIYEREVGHNGFYGAASHLHHKHPPTAWVNWSGSLRPKAFDLNQLNVSSSSPWSASVIMENMHCRIRFWCCDQSMQAIARNADGDDLLFIHQGSGSLYCDYGHLELETGDYVLLPRSTLWRIEVKESLKILMVEATGEHFELPEKGIVGKHAIFDPAMLDIPAIDQMFIDQQDESEWEVSVKHCHQLSTITYPFNPLDTLGWHGDVSVVRINWRDIRPLMSHRYHLPPSAHCTLTSKHFIVCTFVPRPIETDPGALKVPFFHSNNDYDEIIFYHHGEFFSRDNISPGMMTFHPCGFTHGPHPKAFAAGSQAEKAFTDEVAVMIDTRHGMTVGEQAEGVECLDYVNSWVSEKS